MLAALVLTTFSALPATYELRPSSPIVLPLEIDSNTPAFWRGGQLVVFSSEGSPLVSTFDAGLIHLTTEPVQFDAPPRLPMWIESVWQDPTGPIYAWYHHERLADCPEAGLKVPEIGALVSEDGGHTFHDLGIILTAPGEDDCSAQNGYFAGGHGDFSVIPDRDHQYLYFLFSSYSGPLESQGIGIARISYGNLSSPVAAVWKFRDGGWSAEGLGGELTPIFPAAERWQSAKADSLWGPSVHWNTYLNAYVVLLNRACCAPGWPQEGTYLSGNRDIGDPGGWTAPVKLVDGGDWYPFVLGLGPNDTPQESGQRLRLFQRQNSHFELEFFLDPPDADPDPDRRTASVTIPPAPAPPSRIRHRFRPLPRESVPGDGATGPGR